LYGKQRQRRPNRRSDEYNSSSSSEDGKADIRWRQVRYDATQPPQLVTILQHPMDENS
jgi:hypothetical protein